ncbi:MAG: sensor histidine kinase [Thermoleophilaceae bacterium]
MARGLRRVEDRWVALFAWARIGATALAVALLLYHRVTGDDVALAVIGAAYGVASALAATRVQGLAVRPAAWLGDGAFALGLIVASGEWRSPFYVFALTALVPPATQLRHRAAIGATGALFTVGYLGAALLVGVDFPELRQTARLESFATQLLMPSLVTLALAYAAALLSERERSSRLALEAERRRIGIELHDSAKQRVHAAHLLLSSFERRLPERGEGLIAQTLRELRGAAADLETSVSELDTALEGRSLDEALRVRCRELVTPDGPRVAVSGGADGLPAFVEAHAYRVASEAIGNALRHAAATRIDVGLRVNRGRLHVQVVDDGRGMPEQTRPGANGLRTMSARAESLGGRLELGEGPGGAGTAVELVVPLDGVRQ